MTASVDSKDLIGVWYNQLGSKMTLRADGSGLYHSNVVGAPPDFDYYFNWTYDGTTTPDRVGVSIGWTVVFVYAAKSIHSAATWSGQFFDYDGKPRIITQWLLSRSTKEGDIWDSTNVGKDTFTKVEPTAAEIAKARALGGSSPEDILLAYVNQVSE